MNYQEWKEARQAEFNKLPIFYAFGEAQFKEQLEKRGIKRDEAADKVYGMGAGGFFLKTDKAIIEAYFAKDTDKELRGMMEADADFARDAIEYEMRNHEYPINWEGDYDVCSCFGNVEYGDDKYATDYLSELGFSNKIINIYQNAAKKVRDEIDW